MDDQIGTDLHVKPTDTHQYLRMDSFHPQHCKSSISYSQALRFRLICSENEHLQNWTRELKTHLLKRGFHEQQLNKEINWALTISRESCLQIHVHPNQEKSARRLLVVTYCTCTCTYHPILPPFQVIPKCYLSTLHTCTCTSEQLQRVVPLPRLLAFRHPRNLKDFLVRASLTVTAWSRAAWQPPLRSCWL